MSICENKECMLDNELFRFTYINNCSEYAVKFIIDKYYIYIDYFNNKTSISELDLILLKNMVVFNFVIDFNFSDKKSILNKINKMLVLS